jgi:hypothetical protein
MKPDGPTARHLKQEAYHAAQRLFLSPAFSDAYKYGILVFCVDEIWRRAFPRFGTHAMDYIEK